MRVVELEEAVQEIHRSREVDGEDHPFFFLAGAGLSSPLVPLARDIQLHCRSRALEFGYEDPPAGTVPLDAYSYWFERAYPQPIHRQWYLRELIENQPISHANLRLAHLLLSGVLGSLVVTPNFDDFLSRAHIMFGRHPIVCDHPSTAPRINPESADIQIVHVHGTYWFYDCCNLRGELDQRAAVSETQLSMSSLLDRILAARSPIVLGYSGWPEDVFMSALRRRLEAGPLAYNLYWFCYSRGAVAPLRSFFGDHPSVRLVVPGRPAEVLKKEAETGGHGSTNLRELLGQEESDDAPTLPAHLVLDQFIRTFDLPAPELTSDPLRFFAKELRRGLPEEIGGGAEDIYSIRDVVARLERASESEAQERSASQALLDLMRDDLRRSRYREVIQTAGQLELTALAVDELRQLVRSLWSAAVALLDNSPEELLGYDLLLEAGEVITSRVPLAAQELAPLFARSLHNKGLTLMELGRPGEALAAFEDLESRYGSAPSPNLQPEIAGNLYSMGLVLDDLGRHEDALAAFDQVDARFGEVEDATVQESVARAQSRRVLVFCDLGRYEEAISAADEVDARFRDNEGVRRWVAAALVSKSLALEELERRDEELATYAEVERRYATDERTEVQHWVASALARRAIAFEDLERWDDALEAYDEFTKRFGETLDLPTQRTVAHAMLGRARVLRRLSGPDEAIQAYEDSVEKLSGTEEPDLKAILASALEGKADLLVSKGQHEKALDVYEDIEGRFGSSPDSHLRPIVARTRYRRGRVLEHLAEPEQAVAEYESLKVWSDDQDEGIREYADRARQRLEILLKEES